MDNIKYFSSENVFRKEAEKLDRNPFGRTGAIGQGLLPIPGRNQTTYLIVIAGNRFLTRKVGDTENQIPFHIDKTNEQHAIDELERNLNLKFHVIAYDMLMDNPFNTGDSIF